MPSKRPTSESMLIETSSGGRKKNAPRNDTGKLATTHSDNFALKNSHIAMNTRIIPCQPLVISSESRSRTSVD